MIGSQSLESKWDDAAGLGTSTEVRKGGSTRVDGDIRLKWNEISFVGYVNFAQRTLSLQFSSRLEYKLHGFS